MRKAFGAFRFGLFLIWCAAQFPFLWTVAWLSQRIGLAQFCIFSAVCSKLLGVRRRMYGMLDKKRPLLLVANHISVFEFLSFSAAFGCGFFAKAEIRKYPVVGLAVRNFGNAFVDRRPARAARAVATIRRQMSRARAPYAVFPEGTTSNGSRVLPFKSAMFDFLSGAPEVEIQPVVLLYRDKDGNRIQPQKLADEYAYFDNIRQPGPPYCKKERSVFDLLMRTALRGGFTTEIHILPQFNPRGLDRKEIAERLHGIISKKFQELA